MKAFIRLDSSRPQIIFAATHPQARALVHSVTGAPYIEIRVRRQRPLDVVGKNIMYATIRLSEFGDTWCSECDQNWTHNHHDWHYLGHEGPHCRGC